MRRPRLGIPTLLGLVVAACVFAGLWPMPLEQPRAVITQSGHKAFSPDGNTLLLSSSTRTAIFDLKTGTLRAQVATEEIVGRCCFSADGTRWALPGAATVTVRDTGDGRVLETHPQREGAMHFAFSSEGRLLYLDTNFVRDLATQEIVFDWRPPKDLMLSPVSFQRGLLFLGEVKSDDLLLKAERVAVYQMSTGRRLWTLPADEFPCPDGVAWGGRFLVTVKGKNADLYWLDAQTGESSKLADGFPALFPALSPDGQIVAKIEGGNAVPAFLTNRWPNLALLRTEVSLFDLRTGRVVGSVPGRNPDFTPDGRTLIVYGEDQRTLNLWDYPLPNWWWLRVSIAALAGFVSVPVFRWLRRRKAA